MAGQIVKVDVKEEMKRLQKFFKKDISKAIKEAGRQAVNLGLRRLQKDAVIKTKKEIRLKSGELKNDFFRVFPAKKGELTSTFFIRPKKISLRRFVISPKSTPTQKGVKVKQRKIVRVKISPKRGTIALRHLFWAKGTKGQKPRGETIFRQTSRTKTEGKGLKRTALPIAKKIMPGVFIFFLRRQFTKPLLKAAEVRVKLTFPKRVKFLIEKEAARNFKKNFRAI